MDITAQLRKFEHVFTDSLALHDHTRLDSTTAPLDVMRARLYFIQPSMYMAVGIERWRSGIR